MIVEKKGYVIRDVKEDEYLVISYDFDYDTTEDVSKSDVFETEEDAEEYLEDNIEEEYLEDFEIVPI